jgi:hypothetical protein
MKDAYIAELLEDLTEEYNTDENGISVSSRNLEI